VFELVPQRVRRTVKSGAPVALVTAGLGVGATGIAGQRVERASAAVVGALADAVGVDPGLGPALLVLGAVLVFALAFVAPGLFRDANH
jgi:hypothetical protein